MGQNIDFARHCGGIFCNDCASFRCTIPKFNLKKPVRVCKRCYNFLQKTVNKPAEEVNRENYLAKVEQNAIETTWMPYPDDDAEEKNPPGRETPTSHSPTANFYENQHYLRWKLAVHSDEEQSSSPDDIKTRKLERRSSSQDITNKEELYLEDNSRSL
jgi:hypothetical protein